ncbi:hypothetical protein Sango_0431600 [Sesamum angolense]|uniref:Senescence regulator n=1 Tax=Sesamum angolense TaxID=2727404 RepID=A0AAE1XAV5_9LAMI|nr:hypothetical protein Sango_0431600 [Sesamum angolense]
MHMAAPRSYLGRSNYRFLPIDHGLSNDSIILELDESEVWNSGALSPSSEIRKSSYRIHRKRSAGARASSPVNVPDWSKILKEEYRENGRREGDDYEEEVEENEDRIPPHEFLARTRTASFSVQDGRDLRRVRNAIWQRIGFQD